MKLLIFFLSIAAGAIAWSQPSRAAELFGTFGVMRGGGDEGSEGSAAAYGGAVTIPFANRWAFDVQALTARLSDRTDFGLRRVLVSPGLQYRRGNERALWFIAFGPGLQRDRDRGVYLVFDNGGVPRSVSFDDTSTSLTLHWRTGGVFQVARRMLVRGDFFWVNRYILPNVGVTISLGIRLGR